MTRSPDLTDRGPHAILSKVLTKRKTKTPMHRSRHDSVPDLTMPLTTLHYPTYRSLPGPKDSSSIT